MGGLKSDYHTTNMHVMNNVSIYCYEPGSCLHVMEKKGHIAPKYNDYTRKSLHALVAFLERGEMNLLRYSWN